MRVGLGSPAVGEEPDDEDHARHHGMARRDAPVSAADEDERADPTATAGKTADVISLRIATPRPALSRRDQGPSWSAMSICTRPAMTDLFKVIWKPKTMLPQPAP